MGKKIALFVVIGIIAGAVITQAQNIRKHIALEWQNHPYIEEGKEYIYFSGATYQEDFGSLPLYCNLFTENMARKTGSVTISNAIFIPMRLEYLLTEEEKALIPDTLYYTTQDFPELRRSNLAVTLLPFRKNSETGEIERLFCADISVDFCDSRVPLKMFVDEFPVKSPLSEGDCYKIRIDKTGVFRITGKNLKDMGMDIASVNPKNLKMYGMTGGVLPEMNSNIPNTGIKELAIYVSGQDNSVLSEADYILFYGESAHSWTCDSISKVFKHTYNYYDDYNYYFITATGGQGKRIQTENNNNLTENATTGQGDYYMFHEQDLTNVIKAGRNWVGESFSTGTRERTFTVNVPDAVTSESFLLRTGVLASCTAYSSVKYSYTVNGTGILNISASAGNTSKIIYYVDNKPFTAPSGSFTLKISFEPKSNGDEGWLDYFEIQARRNLVFNGEQMTFRDIKTFAPEKITKFNLQNTTSQTTIWDVTDFYNVRKMATENNGQSFKAKTDILREFIAFDNRYGTPAFIGKIEKQNLQGMRDIQSVIVSHPDFFDEAKKIEDEHRNNLGLKTLLVSTEQIYNEFSSGRQDISAIRDFMRMLHLTAGANPPQYLLLIGDASWDYKNTIKQSNFAPAWSSMLLVSGAEVKHNNSLIGDDFFALLDEKEGSNFSRCIGILDIAVGRFPVNTAAEMQSVVKKRLHYTSNASETMGTWRNVITFVSDDPDPDMLNGKDTYSISCEEHENVVIQLFPEAVVEKIYADSYKRVVSPGGTRYPDANKALTARIDRGTLILNYVGHGSKFRWSNEALLDIPDVNHWKNPHYMPFVMTESCSNAPFDDYEVTTLGETMFLRPDGGAIGLLVSTRETGNTSNNKLVNALYEAMLPSADNNYRAKSIGIATMEAKQKTFNDSGTNTQMYTLFGDPALTLSFPKYNIVCTEINGKDAASTIDTISALTIASFKGEIRNIGGSLKSDFNGMVYPTVFDKEIATKTLGQIYPDNPLEYKMWKSIIFKGAAKVENGKFSFDFFVPKDINYEYDFSKVVFYASDETQKIDANGVFSNFVVGGLNPDAEEDTTPPEIRLFMNDTLFVAGGYTNENPILLALLYDENGINATGSSIGHNITAVLDGDVNNEMNLNNFYQTETNDYKRGRVVFPLYDLEEGEHTITVRAWDSYNNSVKGSLTFVVVGSNKFVMRNLYNYPNPFNAATNFVFEHNASDETLNINIRIFDLMGRLVHEIQQTIDATGYRIPPIRWKGDNGGGSLLSGGYYIYQMTVKTSSGATVKKSGKLVISR